MSDYSPEITARLKELGQIGREIDKTSGKLDDLYARRADLYIALREANPPLSYREIAAAAGATEASVTQVMLKARRQGLTSA